MSTPRSGIHRRAFPLLLAAAAGCVLLLKPIQGRIDTLNAGRAEVDPDLMYFSSPGMLQKTAMGYDSLLADVYWMRAIQYYGRREEAAHRAVRYKNLPMLLDITTTLDPMLMQAYRAGSSFLSEPDPVGAGQPEAALKLLDKGIARHPHDWRLYYDKGFVYFWFLKDPGKAGKTWLEASGLADRPAWMPSLAALALSRGGDAETARALWRQQYRESERADIRENAWNHLASMQVNEDLWTLEYFLECYKRQKGALPADLAELVQAGLMRSIPADPSGVPYSYDRTTGAAQLSIHSHVRYLPVPYDYRETFMARLDADAAR